MYHNNLYKIIRLFNKQFFVFFLVYLYLIFSKIRGLINSWTAANGKYTYYCEILCTMCPKEKIDLPFTSTITFDKCIIF